MRTNTVGRLAELAVLDGVVADVAAGRPRTVEVRGDPGIGKSHLLSVIRNVARRRGIPVAVGRSAHHLRAVPFGIVVDSLVEPLARLPAADRLALCRGSLDVLAPLFPFLRDGPVARPACRHDELARVGHAIRAVVERLAARDGLVMLLDDVHWADPASAELLAYLVTHRPRGGVLLGIAHRPRQLPVVLGTALQAAYGRGELDLLRLGPLSGADTRMLVGPELSPAEHATLHELAEGNPCYLTVLLYTHRAGGNPAARRPFGTDAAMSFPPHAWTTLAAEIETLPQGPRLVAEAAAIVGDAPPSVLRATAELTESEVLAALDVLTRRDILHGGGNPSSFRFRHPVLRHFVYQATKAGWQVGAHARAAAALARPATSAQASHVERCGRCGDPLAAPATVVVDHAEGPPTSIDRLSRRERDVAELIAQGCTNRQIARRLDVKENTVEVHVGRILRKLGVRSRAAVASIVTLRTAAMAGTSLRLSSQD